MSRYDDWLWSFCGRGRSSDGSGGRGVGRRVMIGGGNHRARFGRCDLVGGWGGGGDHLGLVGDVGHMDVLLREVLCRQGGLTDIVAELLVEILQRVFWLVLLRGCGQVKRKEELE